MIMLLQSITVDLNTGAARWAPLAWSVVALRPVRPDYLQGLCAILQGVHSTLMFPPPTKTSRGEAVGSSKTQALGEADAECLDQQDRPLPLREGPSYVSGSALRASPHNTCPEFAQLLPRPTSLLGVRLLAAVPASQLSPKDGHRSGNRMAWPRPILPARQRSSLLNAPMVEHWG